MAKNFPYFKFLPTEWLTGNIAYEDLDVQGLFINVCSLYWQRDGSISLDDIKRRYKREDLIEKLISGSFLCIIENMISISFLDEQLHAANHISKKNSENGKKSAYLKALKTKENSTTVEPLFNEASTNFNKVKKNKNNNKNNNISNVDTFDFDKLLIHINNTFKREFKLINQSVRKSFNARLNDGYTKKDVMLCIENLSKNKYHLENGFQYCTPEFISRATTMEKYSSKGNIINKEIIASTSNAPHLNL